MNIIAVFNRDGGTFRTTDMAAYEAKVIEVFEGAGHRIECRIVAGNEVADALKAASNHPDVECIVAGGGDGTISSAARLAWKSGKVLGVVPAGTMNLFARSLQLPLDVWAVLETLASAESRKVDIASANGQSFVHQFSAGMRPRMVRLRDAMEFGSRFGKIRATIRATLTAMARPPRFEVFFNTDGKSRTQQISAISVSNNEFGNDALMFAEKVDEGHLGIYLADPLTFRSAVHLAFDILRGKLKENPAITAFKTSEISLHFPRHRHGIRCVMDGEIVAMDQAIVIRTHPGELKVLVAAASSKSLVE
ncbi:diacylglycerol/lipid kinase family protein [Endobacterium cereale]|uniref:diacylglycerol/lipid kinase family protein n=1 Tax=Endobacterium cereale TaxID=2663029 RepID=UPI002B486C06|nr:diacylglycerol kinase family protein [Endobacterium cereale]MEB2848028.1 diacylglycerol kinase family protein [Endobacterium cereale]